MKVRSPQAIFKFFQQHFKNTGDDLSGGQCGQIAYLMNKWNPELKIKGVLVGKGEIGHIVVEYEGKLYDGMGVPLTLRPGEKLLDVELVPSDSGNRYTFVSKQKGRLVAEAMVEVDTRPLAIESWEARLIEGAEIKLPALIQTAAKEQPTINQIYRDAVLRHQVDVRRYTAGVNKQVATLLEKADAELVEKLRARLAKFEGKPLDVTSERWKALLADIRDWRHSALQDYKDLTRKELGEFSVHEGQANTTMLNNSVGLVDVEFASVAGAQLRAIITSQPFQGRLLNDWFNTLEAADQVRLVQAIQLGMTQGETIDDIVRRVVGTREAGYADGILSITRRDAQGIVRTAVNFVSNEARDSVLEENDDIVTAKIWVSTLDGRTTPICQANDGKGTPIGNNELPKGVQPLQPPGITPPAHFNCRSTMVGYIDGVGLVGKRPYVSDTRTRKSREADFEAEAATTGRPIQDIRQDWADANVGDVPSATNYNDWLKGQSAQFQDEVLGPTRGKLFREGGVTLDQFVDRSGNELTIEQLKARL